MNRNFIRDLITWRTKLDRKPLILRGARQVGKTFGVTEFARAHFEKVFVLNFEKNRKLKALFDEDIEPQTILKRLENHFHEKIDPLRHLIFFDEIQECERALNALKYFAEEIPRGFFMAAGSLLGLFFTQEPFPVGKVEYCDVFPMTFAEFLGALGSWDLLDEARKSPAPWVHEKLLDLMKHYLITGGAPEIVQLYLDSRPRSGLDFDPIRKRQEELLNSYLADMAKHSGKLNSMHLERLWRQIPEQLARESQKRFIFKGVLPQRNKYSQLVEVIDWLETAGLVYRVGIANRAELPLQAFIKESAFKLYLFDVGILGALGGLDPKTIIDYDFGTFKGYLLENFVLQELVASSGKRVFSWHEGTAEVDFLKDFHGQITPIEVKSGINRKAKSLAVFVGKYRPPQAIRLSTVLLPRARPGVMTDLPVYLAGSLPSLIADQDNHFPRR